MAPKLQRFPSPRNAHVVVSDPADSIAAKRPATPHSCRTVNAFPRLSNIRFPGWFERNWRNSATVAAIFLGAVLASPKAFDGTVIFLSPGNLTDALRALVPVAIVALAMTLVVLTGGIDLSVGSTLALAGVLTSRLITEWRSDLAQPVQMFVSIAIGALAGLLVGAINGGAIAWLRIQPFIVTLASMIGIRGLALWTANNERIGLGVGQDLAGQFGEFFARKGVMVGTWMALTIAFLILLNRTVFGRQLRALGDNPSAAYLAGLPVKSILVAVYGLSGLAAGLAGVLLTARTTTGDPNAGVAFELDAIAVVVIGGGLPDRKPERAGRVQHQRRVQDGEAQRREHLDEEQRGSAFGDAIHQASKRGQAVGSLVVQWLRGTGRRGQVVIRKV